MVAQDIKNKIERSQLTNFTGLSSWDFKKIKKEKGESFHMNKPQKEGKS